MTWRIRVRALALVPACLAAGAVTFAACGGDDNGGGGASDEEFVGTLCDALDTFANDTNELITGADADADQDELFNDLAGIIRDLADELDGANPPDDLAPANDQLVSALNEAADGIEDGDLSVFDSIGAPDFDLSEERQAELREIANNNETCTGLEDQGFGDLFDGN